MSNWSVDSWYVFSVLKPECDDKVFLDIVQDFRQSCKDANWCLDKSGGSSEWYTWHTLEEDLRMISAKYPEYVFLMTVQVDSDDANYHIYAKNGLLQIEEERRVIDEYDESKLK